MATQAERSRATREKLLDATVACLLTRGYRRTSTPEVCKRAGVSRGAQLHHYATKEELVAAAVEHVMNRRLSELRTRLDLAPGGVLDLTKAASFMWLVYTGDTFYVWLELVVAARTEPALLSLMREVDARFLARAEAMCKAFLLPHVTDPAEITATTRLILSIFDGLATHRILTGDDMLPKRALGVAAKAGLFTPRGKA